MQAEEYYKEKSLCGYFEGNKQFSKIKKLRTGEPDCNHQEEKEQLFLEPRVLHACSGYIVFFSTKCWKQRHNSAQARTPELLLSLSNSYSL